MLPAPHPRYPHGELLFALEEGRRFGEQFGLPEPLRPCAAKAILDGAPEGRRNETLFFISCDLRRAGAVEEEHLFRLLRGVNERAMRPPLPLAEVRDIARKAVRPRADGRPYLFTCRGDTGRGWCLVPHEQDACPWAVFRAAKRRTKPAEEFWRFFRKWAGVLTLRELRLYQAILETEALRGVAPGTPFFASLREVAARSGLDLRHVRPTVERLAAWGLISFKPGEAGTATHKSRTASTWARTLPLPSPSHPLPSLSRSPP